MLSVLGIRLFKSDSGEIRSSFPTSSPEGFSGGIWDKTGFQSAPFLGLNCANKARGTI